MTKLGEYLRAQGMSQTKFAELAGLDRAMVTHYVQGYRRPGLTAALLIAKHTAGAVPAEYWAAYSVRRRRKRHPPKVALP